MRTTSPPQACKQVDYTPIFFLGGPPVHASKPAPTRLGQLQRHIIRPAAAMPVDDAHHDYGLAKVAGQAARGAREVGICARGAGQAVVVAAGRLVLVNGAWLANVVGWVQ